MTHHGSRTRNWIGRLTLAAVALGAPWILPGDILFAATDARPASTSSAAGDEGSTPPSDNPIELSRQAVAESPDDANAHLALSRALGQAINDNPADAPLYAWEMLSSLQTAVALDPALVEAYHYLVGYYLNAPPIAGGSVDKAEDTARALAEFDPEGSERLLSRIEAHREPKDSDEGSL